MTLHEEKEYDSLRKELEIYISKISFMISVLYVSATAVLAWAIENQNPFICSTIYCIIIPSFLITHSYNISIMRIGAYFIVFYDDYKWEKRLHEVNKKVSEKDNGSNDKKFNRLPSPYKSAYIFVGVLSSVLSWIIFLGGKNDSCNVMLWVNNICCVIIAIIFIVVVLMTKDNDKIKELYIEKWREVRETETKAETQSCERCIEEDTINT